MSHGVYRGSDVLRQLEAGYRRLRGDAERIDGRLKRLEADGQDNLRRRGDTLVDLARLYLPDLERDTVETTFAEVRSKLRELLVAKQQRQRELDRDWDTSLDARQQAEAELERITERLDTLVARRDELEAELAGRLRSDQDFQRLSSDVIAAEKRIARNEERVEESRQEAADKLPAYEQSRLFRYLVDRGYGTPGYTGSGLTRQLDRWVARLVDFNAAKRSYDFLRTTPELMDAEVDRRRGEFEDLMQRVDAIEEQASAEIGLTDVLSQGVDAGARRDDAVGRLEAIEQDQQRLGDEIRRLDASQGEFHHQAVERMKVFLGTMRESALEAHTRSTADPTDDRLMEEIRWLNDRLDEARDESEKLHPELAAKRGRARDLGKLLQQFRRAEFDSQRSTFASRLDIGRRVEEFVAGSVSAGQLWDELRSHHEFEPTWSEREWQGADPGGMGRGGEFSHVLLHVLAEAAGAAIRHAADHHARQSQSRSGRSEPWRRPPSVRRRAGGGFTRGRGF